MINQGTLWVRELRSIFEEFELNQSLYEHVLLSHLQSCKLPRCHKQAGCYISPGHHVADTKLQILVRFSSNFVAIFTLCSSAVRLKRMGNFEWIERVIPLLVLSLTFQLKANDCVWTHSCICLHANEGHESTQRIPCIIRISMFRAFPAGKKCALYLSKYGM